MSVFLFLTAVLLVLLLIFTKAVRLASADESLFELRRRQRIRDGRAADTLRMQSLRTQGAVLTGPLQAVLMVLLTALFVYLLGWAWGLITSLLIGLFYGRIAELAFVRKTANKLYKQYEPALLGVVSKYKKTIQFIGGKRLLEERVHPIGSREELAHLLEQSPVFTEEDTALLKNTFRFKERTVEELMTPKEKIVTVDDSELLGPLVLDDLHKTGHTIFPVVKGGAVVGLLDSSDHVDLHTKESVHVRSVMHTDVAKGNEAMTLDEALRALLASKEQLLIVLDDSDQMTGILSLKDVVRALTG